MLTHLAVDDFPDFVLEGFGDIKRMTGCYPRMLIVSFMLGQMMGATCGEWRPTGDAGIWAWVRYLRPEIVEELDEFGFPD